MNIRNHFLNKLFHNKCQGVETSWHPPFVPALATPQGET